MADRQTEKARRSGSPERRHHPRRDRKIEINLRGESQTFDIRGHTWNLSPVGTYCRVNRAIAEMTQLMMVLDLPTERVVCKGTVVRQKPDPQDPRYHHLAIFFHEISDADKAKLTAFVEN